MLRIFSCIIANTINIINVDLLSECSELCVHIPTILIYVHVVKFKVFILLCTLVIHISVIEIQVIETMPKPYVNISRNSIILPVSDSISYNKPFKRDFETSFWNKGIVFIYLPS